MYATVLVRSADPMVAYSSEHGNSSVNELVLTHERLTALQRLGL